MTPEEFAKIAKEYFAKYKPYIEQIDEAVAETPDGNITLELRVYHGFVTDVVVMRKRRFTFKKPIDELTSTE